jgi:hypothetical protein
MRRIALLLLATGLASCTTAPPSPTRAARSQAELQSLIAGKVAQPAVSCLPSYNADDMVVIDENTIAFRSGASRVYVAHMNGPCSNLGGAGNYALLTKNVGGGLGLCSGEIAQVVDTSSHMTVGSCSFGEFVPYIRPRG